MTNRVVRLWAVVWCGVAGLHAWSLLRFPAPFVDEAWNANRATAFLTDRVAYGSLDAGVFERFEGYWTYLPVIPTALHAFAIRITGGATFAGLRLQTLAFGVALLVACYRIGAHASDRTTGLTAAFLTSLSAFFLLSAHLARWEIMVAAAGYWSLALIITNERRSPVVSALAGLLTGLAFEIHPHALVFILPSLGVYAWQSGFYAITRRDVWAWSGGGLAGAFVYLALHVLQYPKTFLAISAVAHGPTHVPPIATLDPSVLGASMVGTVKLLAWNVPWFAAWTIAAASRVRRWRSLSVLDALVAAMVVSAVLVLRNKFMYYGILVSPALDLLLAQFLREPLTRASAFAVLSRAAAAAALLVGFITNVTTMAAADGRRSLDAAVRVIEEGVRPNDVLMGAQTYWFGLQGHRYLSWEQLVYYKRIHPDSTVQIALRELKPDILIIDNHLRAFLRDDQEGSYGGRLNVSRREVDAALSACADEVRSASVPTYGTIRVYRFRWSHAYSDDVAGLAPPPRDCR